MTAHFNVSYRKNTATKKVKSMNETAGVTDDKNKMKRPNGITPPTNRCKVCE